jgi:tetratricopeptide (TPR) repeat protein
MKRTTLIIVACFYLVNNSAHAELLCYWKLDQTSGTKIKDYSGNNYDGLAEGGHWIVENGRGTAFECTSKRVISIDPCFLLKLDKEITISLWQNLSNWEKVRTFLCDCRDSDNRRTINVYLPWENGKIYWDAGITPEGKRHRIDRAVNETGLANTWNHWVFTKDALGNMAIYLNGSLWHKKTLLKNISLNGEKFDLIRDYPGSLRDVAIFDMALSQEQVVNLYRIGTEIFTCKPPLLSDAWETLKKYQDNKECEKIIEFVSKNHLELPENPSRADEIIISDIYFILGSAYKTLGQIDETKKAYIESMTHRSLDISCYAADLFRIYKDLPPEEIRIIIENNIRNTSIFKFEIGDIASYFEGINEFDLFKIFVTSVFSIKGNSSEYAELIGASLNSVHFKGFLYSYCENSPELLQYVMNCDREEIDSYVKQGNYEKAYSICEQLEEKAQTKKNKGLFAYECGRILFKGGSYKRAIEQLESFIVTYKSSHRLQVIDAMAMIGRSYVQLGMIDEAINEFFSLLTEFPETDQASEANFFIGYSYMLQNKFDLAKEALNLLVEDYPQSSYAGKAKLCLTRINSMIEK